jgi:hypothetical protein
MFVASRGHRSTLANLGDGLPDMRAGRGGLVLDATRRRLVLQARRSVRNVAPPTPHEPLTAPLTWDQLVTRLVNDSTSAATFTREPSWDQLTRHLLNQTSKES